MEAEQNYYTVLGVAPDATEAEIRRAFRARAKASHPDINPAFEHGEAYHDFGLLTKAYETLKDARRREAYDRELMSSRELATPGGKHGSRRAFAAGVALGLAFAIAVIGGKTYLDRAARATKTQDSLSIEKAEKHAAPAEQAGGGQPDRFADAPVPAADKAKSMESDAAAPSGRPEDTHRFQFTEGPAVHAGGGANPDGVPSVPGPLTAASPPAIQPAEIPDAKLRPQNAPHSRFAQTVLLLERAINSGGGGVPAYRLVSLVNSAGVMEELSEAASLAQRPQTLDLIRGRIAALKSEQVKRAAAPVDPAADLSLQDRASGGRVRLKQTAAIEISTGTRTNETILRLHPGGGLNESFSDCRSCPEMVVIPAGQAIMGSKPETLGYRAEEAPAHRIAIRKAFAVSKRGISAENWRACVDAGVCRPTLASFLSVGPGVPATRVSWFEAKAYVDWLSKSTGRRYHLLSEAEWEYAAQAGSESHQPQTTAKPDRAPPEPAADLGLLHLGSGSSRLSVTRPNAWGVHAMAGNVLEWVEDCWHANYSQAPADGSPWLSGAGGDCAYRAVRGASSGGGQFGGRRAAARAREFADVRSPALGFRVARELSEAAKTALDATGGGGKATHGE